MAGRNWTPEEKIRIVHEYNISLADPCRKYNLNPNIYRLKKFMEGGKLALMGELNKFLQVR
ncbi:MAG: hypothetical protein QXG99_08485 [Conexivisphaerales archaeon]